MLMLMLMLMLTSQHKNIESQFYSVTNILISNALFNNGVSSDQFQETKASYLLLVFMLSIQNKTAEVNFSNFLQNLAAAVVI